MNEQPVVMHESLSVSSKNFQNCVLSVQLSTRYKYWVQLESEHYLRNLASQWEAPNTVSLKVSLVGQYLQGKGSAP